VVLSSIQSVTAEFLFWLKRDWLLLNRFLLTIPKLFSLHIAIEVTSFHNPKFAIFTYLNLLSTDLINSRDITLHRQIVFNFGSCEFIDRAVGDSWQGWPFNWGVLGTFHHRNQNVTQDIGHGTLFVSLIMLRLAYKTANYRPDERLLVSLESLLLIEVILVIVYVHVCAYRRGTHMSCICPIARS
jgi:hypothetical protein